MDTPIVALQVKNASPVCRIAYAGAAMVHPATLFCLGAGVGLGLLAGSVLAGVTAVAVLVALAWVVSTTMPFRHRIDERTRERARMHRRHRREERLASAGAGREALNDLSALVDSVERVDPELARRYELQDLLDHHVEMSVSYERCLCAMRMADRNALVNALGSASPPGGRRAHLVERRLRTWDRCRAEADRCVDELASTAELIRLIAERAACPELRFDDDALERRIADLDEEEAALRQLA